jgi:hypothetical protein
VHLLLNHLDLRQVAGGARKWVEDNFGLQSVAVSTHQQQNALVSVCTPKNQTHTCISSSVPHEGPACQPKHKGQGALRHFCGTSAHHGWHAQEQRLPVTAADGSSQSAVHSHNAAASQPTTLRRQQGSASIVILHGTPTDGELQLVILAISYESLWA